MYLSLCQSLPISVALSLSESLSLSLSPALSLYLSIQSIHPSIHPSTHLKGGNYARLPSEAEVDRSKIQGPDNPTSQLLPIMSIKGCSRDREGKGKEAVKDREVKTVVCDKVECERWCVTKQEGM